MAHAILTVFYFYNVIVNFQAPSYLKEKNDDIDSCRLLKRQNPFVILEINPKNNLKPQYSLSRAFITRLII